MLLAGWHAAAEIKESFSKKISALAFNPLLTHPLILLLRINQSNWLQSIKAPGLIALSIFVCNIENWEILYFFPMRFLWINCQKGSKGNILQAVASVKNQGSIDLKAVASAAELGPLVA